VRRGDGAVGRELLAKIARQIRHLIEGCDAAAVHPTLQLARAKGLAAPLPDQIDQRRAAYAQQVDRFTDGFARSQHDDQRLISG